MNFDRAALLAMFKPAVVEVDLTINDKTCHLYVKQLSAAEVFALQDASKKNSDNRAFSNRLLSAAICDAEGNSVLSEKEAGELAEMTVGSYNKLAEVVAEACGIKADTSGKD